MWKYKFIILILIYGVIYCEDQYPNSYFNFVDYPRVQMNPQLLGIIINYYNVGLMNALLYQLSYGGEVSNTII